MRQRTWGRSQPRDGGRWCGPYDCRVRAVRQRRGPLPGEPHTPSHHRHLRRSHPEQLTEIINVNQSLTGIINQAPPDLAAILTPINEPLQQFVDSGGTVTLDSDYEVRVLRNILDAMKWCADAGFVFE